jgi:hypothetical protein
MEHTPMSQVPSEDELRRATQFAKALISWLHNLRSTTLRDLAPNPSEEQLEARARQLQFANDVVGQSVPPLKMIREWLESESSLPTPACVAGSYGESVHAAVLGAALTARRELIEWLNGSGPSPAQRLADLDVLATSALLIRERNAALRQLLSRERNAAPKNRTADSKADKPKKKKCTIPENPDVLKLAKRIKDKRNKNRPLIDVALDFTEGKKTKAESLLRQLRRYLHLLD